MIEVPIDRDRHEITRHGSYEFPLAIYHTDLSKNVLGFINWHWHDEIQFCLVTAGTVRFFVGGQQYLCPVGDGIFIGSGALHMTKPEGDPCSAFICLDFHPRLLSSFPGSVFEREYVAPYLASEAMAQVPLSQNVPWQRDIMSAITQIDKLFNEKEFGCEFAIAALMSRMWVSLLKNRQAGGPRSKARSSAVIQAMMTDISLHYSERLFTALIAKNVSFSPSECCRIFKKVTGQTIFSYLTAFRLTKGTELLLSTGLPVSQIAYEVGFCSTSYFIEVFKAHFGMTPLQYRKKSEGKPPA